MSAPARSDERSATGAEFSILIATCGRPDSLVRTLHAIQSSDVPSSCREILVVENGGEQGAAEVCAASAGPLAVRHLYVAEARKSRALNRGLEAARTPAIVFFDDDVRVSRTCLTSYAGALARFGPGHFFGGPVLPDFECEPPAWMRDWLPPSVAGWNPGSEERYYDRPYFIGSNWASWREEMLGAGGFAEFLGPGNPSGALGDETELQARLLESGSRGVYLPGAPVHHAVKSDVCSLEWIRERRRRMGVTRALIESIGSRVPTRRERLVRITRVGVLRVKVMIARALSWSDQRRAWIELTLAEETGYRQGWDHASRRDRAASTA